MIVVSDTSPLSALITIGKAGLLQNLFGKVLIPPVVRTELLRFHSTVPDFLQVQPVTDLLRVAQLEERLDLGEAEAIVLAQETRADYLLMDEIAGREIARQQGLRVIGVVGVLLAAKQHQHIGSVRAILDQLENETTFFISRELKDYVLQEAGET